jgi:hypothetical protein
MLFSLSLRETGRVGRFSHVRKRSPQDEDDEDWEADECCSTFFCSCSCASACFSCEDDVRDRRKSKAALMRARRKMETRSDKRME